MGIHLNGEYYAKAQDAGPHVSPSIPTDEYKENYDLIQWDTTEEKEE